jgi:undecaprenyl-diphosphatase
MNSIEAIIFGIIQGATEFLPISSSGHLALAHYFFGIQEGSLAFDVALHMGTLLGIIIYFRTDFMELAEAFFRPKNKDSNSKRLRGLLLAICIGTVPGVAAGLFLGEFSETHLRHPGTVALALAGAGLFLLWADKAGSRKRGFESISLIDAILIGIAQGFAIIPGVSRSGSTITAALFLGLDRQASVRFSFLLSAPIIFGAGIYKIPEILKQGAFGDNLTVFFTGFLASAISGYLFIAFLMRFIKARSFAIFSYYRFILAAGVAVTLLLR